MKICAFTDIHGNYEQLLKLSLTEDFIKADKRFCLGDVVGLGPYQKECVDLLMKNDVIYLMGNHEAKMTDLIDDVKDPGFIKQYNFYKNELKEYLPLIKNLQINYDLKIANKNVRFTHYGWFNNNMSNKNEVMKKKSMIEQFGIENDNFDYVFHGHMHCPSEKIENSTRFYNIGSLGLKSPSNYMIIEEKDGDLKITRKSIDFDVKKFLKECEKINYPKWESLKYFRYSNALEPRDGTILVTGGAGYIGCNVCMQLINNNYKIVVVDNLSNSKRVHIDKLINRHPQFIKFYNFDLLDKDKLKDVLIKENITSCIHLAGKKYISESFEKQEEYYKNNVVLTEQLLELMEKLKINKLVFSSSITVYGKTKSQIVDEDNELKPLSPYAEQKKICEQLIEKWQQKNNADAKILRLSNPVGANTHFDFGDDSLMDKYCGVLPYIIKKAEKGESLVFNGGDHPTKDGTTVRDYIHVEDVAKAFINALEFERYDCRVYNIGSGYPGYSVLDILLQTENILGKRLDYTFGPQRGGDVSVFICNNQKAKTEIDFKVTQGLKDMVQSQILFNNSTKFEEIEKESK